jgi:ankyrin repeat protein
VTGAPIGHPNVAIIRHMISRISLAICLTLGFLYASELKAQESNAEESIVLEMAAVYEPQVGEYGITELMIAAMHGDSGKVRALLEAGAKVDDVNDAGATAFMGSAYEGDLATVAVLLEWHADVNHVDNRGNTSLGSVVWGRDAKMVGVLLAHGANPNVSVYASDSSVLQFAAVTGQAEIVDLLIAHGADLTAYGAASLNVAAGKGETDIVRSLLNAGVDANAARGYDDQSAMHMAAAGNHPETIKLLIEHGADVNHLSSKGQSPVRTAISGSFVETTEVLLDNGATVSFKDLLLALEKRNSTVTDAVFEHIDAAELTDNELDQTLIAAELAEHLSLIDAILASNSQRLALQPARLLFATQEADDCVISLWNPGSGKSKILATLDGACSEHVFVAETYDALFVIADDMLHIVPFDRRIKARSIKLPGEQISARLKDLQAKLEAQILTAYGTETSMQGMTADPAAAGILDSGEIGLAIHSTGPADGVNSYLYALRGSGSWELIAERGCDRFDWICAFEQLNGRKIEYWPDLRKIWHPRARTNEYFTSKTLREQHMQWDYVRPDLIQFDVGDQKSLLAYSTSEETHGDYLATSQVKIGFDVTDPPDILCSSCETSLASHYLLVSEAFHMPCRLIDIGTGASVLGPLAFATWVD